MAKQGGQEKISVLQWKMHLHTRDQEEQGAISVSVFIPVSISHFEVASKGITQESHTQKKKKTPKQVTRSDATHLVPGQA